MKCVSSKLCELVLYEQCSFMEKMNRKQRKNAAKRIKVVHKSFILVDQEGCLESVCIMMITLSAELGGGLIGS